MNVDTHEIYLWTVNVETHYLAMLAMARVFRDAPERLADALMEYWKAQSETAPKLPDVDWSEVEWSELAHELVELEEVSE